MPPHEPERARQRLSDPALDDHDRGSDHQEHGDRRDTRSPPRDATAKPDNIAPGETAASTIDTTPIKTPTAPAAAPAPNPPRPGRPPGARSAFSHRPDRVLHRHAPTVGAAAPSSSTGSRRTMPGRARTGAPSLEQHRDRKTYGLGPAGTTPDDAELISDPEQLHEGAQVEARHDAVRRRDGQHQHARSAEHRQLARTSAIASSRIAPMPRGRKSCVTAGTLPRLRRIAQRDVARDDRHRRRPRLPTSIRPGRRCR